MMRFCVIVKILIKSWNRWNNNNINISSVSSHIRCIPLIENYSQGLESEEKQQLIPIEDQESAV
jgi:hypothetical protein